VTHIDLILQNPVVSLFDNMESAVYRIVGECKRANPALVDWCFVRVPQVWRNHVRQETTTRMRAERIRVDRAGGWVGSDSERFSWKSDRVYGLGFASKGAQKGDPHPTAGGDRTAIDSAVTQVLRGTNGFLEFLAKHPHYLTPQASDQRGRVVPVVFITARLWTTDTDLTTAMLETGALPAPHLTQVHWLWLQQNVSPELQHGLKWDEPIDPAETLDEYLTRAYARTVAIVSWTGLEDFLKGGYCCL
jgi:hypothetical protein